MHKNSQKHTFWRLASWLLLLVGIAVLLTGLSALLSPPATGLRLGTEVPVQVLVDRDRRFTIDEVAALPDAAFTPLAGPLNAGYTKATYWLRADVSAVAASPVGSLWLEITPTYLDRVTLYQPEQSGWSQHVSGDAVPMAKRIPVRPLVFPLLPDQPVFLRIETTSAMQLYGTVWQSTSLLAHLSRAEWALGAYQGINLSIALLLICAALALRMRRLASMAVLSVVFLVHGASVRGYPQLWLPQEWSLMGDLMVKIGAFILPAAFAWQGRELLTYGTQWRRLDKALLLLALVPLAGILSIPLDLYAQSISLALLSPWIASCLCAVVVWSNLRRHGPSMVNVLMAIPYTLHSVAGAHTAAAFAGLVPSSVEAGTFWQLEALLFNLLTATAVGVALAREFRDSMKQQVLLVDSLARSEHVLEERVRQRTEELLHTQNALQAALHSEREMRLDQRQFFNMVNHEFRTPLAVVDSAATEQLAFPSPDLESQMERAMQIRRACRRLTALVENCLVSDRLDFAGFRLRAEPTALRPLLQEAGQLVHWSSRHHLQLTDDEAPAEWTCDPMLARIALSNLVDNAVKYAHAGAIFITARLNARGQLEVSVADEGPGLHEQALQRIFAQFERGLHADQARGFGLGLWVARRIAQLHGGNVDVQSIHGQCSCFTLTLAPCAPHAHA